MRLTLRRAIAFSFGWGRGPTAAPCPSTRQSILSVMVEVDAERRAAGLPVPQTPEWTRLRAAAYGTAVFPTLFNRRSTAARPAPQTTSYPECDTYGRERPRRVWSAAVKRNGGLRGSSATRWAR